MLKTLGIFLLAGSIFPDYSQESDALLMPTSDETAKPADISLLDQTLKTLKSELSNLLNKESLPVEIRVNSRVLRLRSNVKQYVKSTPTSPKPGAPFQLIQVDGPFGIGYILRLVFRAYGYPDQFVSPQRFTEPYGFTSYSILRPPHHGFEIAVYYSFESTPSQSPAMSVEHQQRFEKIRNTIEGILSKQ